jgi:hypothetical protein
VRVLDEFNLELLYVEEVVSSVLRLRFWFQKFKICNDLM